MDAKFTVGQRVTTKGSLIDGTIIDSYEDRWFVQWDDGDVTPEDSEDLIEA